jgi:hypothetical protein
MRSFLCSLSFSNLTSDPQKLAEHLESLGYDVVCTQDPHYPELRAELSGEMPETDFSEETLQNAVKQMAESVGLDAFGVLLDQDSGQRFPFLYAHDDEGRERLETQYVVGAALTALEELGKEPPQGLEQSMRKLLAGKPLRAVLYQSGGTTEGLDAEVPMELLMADNDTEGGDPMCIVKGFFDSGEDAYCTLLRADPPEPESVSAGFLRFSPF